MYQVLATPMLWTAFLLYVGLRQENAVQSADIRNARVLERVMQFRRDWMADTTRFDGCRIASALGSPPSFPKQIAEPLRPLISGLEPCSSGASSNPVPNWKRGILVDSVVIRDSTAQAFLTVWRGELRHEETFNLRWISMGEWGIRTVVLSHAVRLTIR